MKKILLLSSLFLVLFSETPHLFAQEVGVGTSWTYNIGYFFTPLVGDPISFSLEIEDEILINDEMYFKLGWNIKLHIDGQKWYVFLDEEKHLLYDFELEAGDTLRISDFLNHNSGVDSIFLPIDSVSYLVTEGNSFKVQHFNRDNLVHIDWGNRFIENIGSNLSFLPQSGLADPSLGPIRCVHFTDGVDVKFTFEKCSGTYEEPFFQIGSKWIYQPWSEQGNAPTVEFGVIPYPNSMYNREKYMVRRKSNGEIMEDSKIRFISSFDKKVYFIKDSGQYKLWYNFSYGLEVGDTVAYYTPSNIGYYNTSYYPEFSLHSDEALHYEINSIDSIVTDEGKVLRRWNVTTLYTEGDSICNIIEVIIEGIGSTRDFWNGNCFYIGEGSGTGLRCFSSSSINYTRIPEGETCEIVGTTEIPIAQINLFPNPTTGDVFIASNIDIHQIDVYNINGKKLISSEHLNRINMANLSNGVYFVQIKTLNGLRSNHRIVKME